MVRILRLTNSSDVQSGVAPDDRASAVAERIVAAQIGEPVETIVRVFTPDAALPEVVERWMERYQPDVFFARASAFWCTYASVPLRLERIIPFAGRALGEASALAAASRWGEYRVFRAARQMAVRTIGGDYRYEPEDIAASLEATLRRVLAHEAVVAAMRGPGFVRESSGTKSGLRRARRRNSSLDATLAAMCERLHVAYASSRDVAEDQRAAPDGFHTNVEGLRLQGELEGALITRAWLAAHPT